MMAALTKPAGNASRLLSRLRRWPLVTMLTIGLLVSMIHCAGCGVALAGNHDVTVSSQDGSSGPDLPDEKLPSHAGHCLSHVIASRPGTVGMTIETNTQRLVITGDSIPATNADLPVFKPPRA